MIWLVSDQFGRRLRSWYAPNLSSVDLTKFPLLITPLEQMAESVDGVVADIPETKKAVIAYRRCIILAIVGSTPADSQALGRIVSSGFLSTVKFWLDQILNGSVGELSWISSFQLSPSVLHRKI